MTTLIAITGGIGSGKSTLSEQIKKRGLSLLDSDAEVGKLYIKPNKKFLSYLKKIKLGGSIKKGKINKKFISEKIFSDKLIKEKLEKYIFKIVRDNRRDFIKKQKNKKTKFVFLDIPLVFENNLSKNFDIIICSISSRKARYKRLKKSKKMPIKTFKKIIKSQTTDVERKKKSDIVIYNEDSKKNYIKKVNKILDNIMRWER